MICDVCGKDGVLLRRVTETYGKGKKLLVIENIPVIKCPHCRESYFDAETLHEIERIKQERKILAVPRSVEVASFV